MLALRGSTHSGRRCKPWPLSSGRLDGAARSLARDWLMDMFCGGSQPAGRGRAAVSAGTPVSPRGPLSASSWVQRDGEQTREGGGDAGEGQRLGACCRGVAVLPDGGRVPHEGEEASPRWSRGAATARGGGEPERILARARPLFPRVSLGQWPRFGGELCGWAERENCFWARVPRLFGSVRGR